MKLLSAQPTKTFTPEDLLTLPDSSSTELVNGQLIEKQTSALSSAVEGIFQYRIHSYLIEHAVAEVYPGSLGYRCFEDSPDMIRKPDTTVVRLERMIMFADTDPDFMPIVPDLAIEVLAPREKVYEIDERVREYHNAGFPLVWVADPKARTVTVHPLNGRPAIFTADDEITAEAALPGFRCKIADFFPIPVAGKTS